MNQLKFNDLRTVFTQVAKAVTDVLPLSLFPTTNLNAVITRLPPPYLLLLLQTALWLHFQIIKVLRSEEFNSCLAI